MQADVSGEVVDFLVENGKPITVGQVRGGSASV